MHKLSGQFGINTVEKIIFLKYTVFSREKKPYIFFKMRISPQNRKSKSYIPENPGGKNNLAVGRIRTCAPRGKLISKYLFKKQVKHWLN